MGLTDEVGGLGPDLAVGGPFFDQSAVAWGRGDGEGRSDGRTVGRSDGRTVRWSPSLR